jgi:hypothetical protein
MCAEAPRRGYSVSGIRKPTKIPAATMDDPERISVNGRACIVTMVFTKLSDLFEVPPDLVQAL